MRDEKRQPSRKFWIYTKLNHIKASGVANGEKQSSSAAFAALTRKGAKTTDCRFAKKYLIDACVLVVGVLGSLLLNLQTQALNLRGCEIRAEKT